MDVYDCDSDGTSSHWTETPLVVAAAFFLFFPAGLYLVWRHSEWRMSTKFIITGAVAVPIMFLALVISVVIAEAPERERIATLLDGADSAWSNNKKQQAVDVYRTFEDEKMWRMVKFDTRPIILSRLVEFHADGGRDREAEKWIAIAKERDESIRSSSPKAMALLERTREPAPVKPSPVKPKPEPSADYQLGKEFQLGDYKYEIQSVEKQRRIGKEMFGEFVGETPSPGAAFVVVTYTIENCTKKSQVVLADDFELLDSQGRKFETSSSVSTALLMTSENKDFLLSELQPGIPRRMQQGFELPEKALESELKLIVPKKGVFSFGEARLKVKVR